jgi:transcriptional regulator with XRE-family HTH domain
MDEYDLIERRIPYTQHEVPYPNYFNIIHYAQQIDQTIPDIKFEHGQQLIEQKVMEVKRKTGKSPVLVLDNLRSLSNYKENDSDDWRPIGVWLKNLRALDCVTIVIDHHGKGENAGPRGSSSKTDWANVSIFIKSVGKGRTPGKMRMEIKFDKARGLRPDETQEYECEYDFDGKWTTVDSQKTQSEELLLEAIYNIKRAEFNKCRTEEKKIEKDLEKGRITKKIFNKLRKALNKEHSSTQQEIADKIGISVGKYNQLYNSSYENYFSKKTNEEYSARKNSALGESVSEEEIKQYQELVDKWTKEREEEFPSKDFGLKYIFPDKYPGGDKLPTKDWLRLNDFYKNDFEAIKKAWITHCNINMEDYE